MPTPHNSAQKGQIADIVFMPGDPARAKMIADTYLENVEVVNDVRANYCYTGYYKGRRVSVMASGMGMPSLGIYAYELYTEYDVKRIIRIGTAGSYSSELKVGDVFVADRAYSESSFAKVMNKCDTHLTYPSEETNKDLIQAAADNGLKAVTGTVHSSDVFYHIGKEYLKEAIDVNKSIAVEMESFALFHIASVLGKEAGCLCTISDSIFSPEIMSPEDRQNNLHTMIRIALESALLADPE